MPSRKPLDKREIRDLLLLIEQARSSGSPIADPGIRAIVARTKRILKPIEDIRRPFVQPIVRLLASVRMPGARVEPDQLLADLDARVRDLLPRRAGRKPAPEKRAAKEALFAGWEKKLRSGRSQAAIVRAYLRAHGLAAAQEQSLLTSWRHWRRRARMRKK
jgi:hypothetical protein